MLKFLKFITYLVLISLSAHAVALERLHTEQEPADDITVQAFSTNLERVLSDSIQSYLKDDAFIISVRAQLKAIKTYQITPIYKTQSSSLDTATTENTNAVENSNTKLSTTEQIEQLKLLIELQQLKNDLSAQLNTQQPQILVATETQLVDKKIKVEQIQIKLWLPETMALPRVKFVEDLITQKAQLNFIRGDKLEILSTQFPNQKSTNQTDETPQFDEVSFNRWAEDLRVYVERVNTQGWILFSIVLFLVLLLCWGVIRTWRNRANTYPNHLYPANYPAYQTHNNLPFDPVRDRLLGQNLNSVQDGGSSQSVSETTRLQEAIRHMVMSSDDLLKNALLSLSSSAEKKRFCSGMIEVLGRIVFLSHAQAGLSPTEVEDIEHEETTVQILSDEDSQQLMLDIYRTLVTAQANQKTQQNQDQPFEFLKSLDDKQTLLLLAKEDAQGKALILSQLDDARSADLMMQQSPQDQVETAMALGQLSQLPRVEYQALANQIAHTARNLPELNEVSIDGDAVLINTLDAMGVTEELAVLNALKTQNPELYHRLKQIYISFSDLSHMPEHALTSLLQAVDRETLALALVDQTQSTRDQLLSVLPQRTQTLIGQRIESLEHPNRDDVAHAKKQLGRAATKMLADGVFEWKVSEFEDTEQLDTDQMAPDKAVITPDETTIEEEAPIIDQSLLAETPTEATVLEQDRSGRLKSVELDEKITSAEPQLDESIAVEPLLDHTIEPHSIGPSAIVVDSVFKKSWDAILKEAAEGSDNNQGSVKQLKK